jgi:hypothetical protein
VAIELKGKWTPTRRFASSGSLMNTCPAHVPIVSCHQLLPPWRFYWIKQFYGTAQWKEENSGYENSPRPFSLSLRISPQFSLHRIIPVPLDASDNDIKLNECGLEVSSWNWMDNPNSH